MHRFAAFALVACVTACDCSAPIETRDASVDSEADSAVMLGRRERCNGVDDDLDGKLDEGCPIRLTFHPGNDFRVSLSNGRIAWVRQPVGTNGSYGDIYVMDLPDGEPRKVGEGIAPSLSGDRIAYLNEGIFVLDLVTGDSRQIEVDDATDFTQTPRLSGDLVAFSEKLAGTEEDYEAYVYDLARDEAFNLGSHPTIQDFPRAERDGRAIAFRDDRHGHHTVGLLHLYDIFVSDEPGAPSRRLTTRDDEQLLGHVRAFEGGRVLTDESFGPLLPPGEPRPCRPTVIDATTGREHPLGEPVLPCFVAQDLSGGRAVVEYDTAGASDLYLWNLDDDSLLQVTDHSRLSIGARLEDDILVWIDDRTDDYEIYMMDLSDLEAGDFSPEGLTP